MAKSIPAQKAWDRVSAIDEAIGDCIDGIGRFNLRGSKKSRSYLQLTEAAVLMENALRILRLIPTGEQKPAPRKGEQS